MKARITLFFLILSITNCLSAQELVDISGVVYNEGNEPQFGVIVQLDSVRKVRTDFDGNYSFQNVEVGQHSVKIYSSFFEAVYVDINVTESRSDLNLVVVDKGITKDTTFIVVQYNDFGHESMAEVDGMTLTSGKKTEVISPDELTYNSSTNNARETFSQISGANIWESDNYGIQLGVGVRGLSPNRSANFNTRQNGYDISADAIGYPESYYTPAFAALQRIEIIRGAGALQFGPQFGGMMNFKFKKGNRNEPIEGVFRQSFGSFGFWSSFLSLGGQIGNVNYYGYVNHKEANGWRPNSSFVHNNAFVGIEHQVSKKFSYNVEYTYLKYLAQQAGGLTDAQFEDMPRQSNRERNWFEVNWNLLAVIFDYKLSDKTKLNWRNFGLSAGRDALGNLERIDRVDDGGDRNLISDRYNNFGSEFRLLTKYRLKNDTISTDTSALVVGARFYRGRTTSRQGVGSSGSDADFKFYDDTNPDGSDFTFPNTNFALFLENQFKLSKKFSITPGVRYEWISTKSDGYYNRVVRDFAGNIISDSTIFEQIENTRSFVLFGLGTSYKFSDGAQLYGNITQNYRPVTFSDIRINNPNKVVDENISDENGYNFDLGLKGNVWEKFTYDVTGFYMRYNDKIGSIYEAEDKPPFRNLKVVRNIADAYTFGLELYAQTDLFSLFKPDTVEVKNNLNWFVNTSLINGKYVSPNNLIVDDKKVELIPSVTFKTGLTFKRKKMSYSVLFTYLSKQFTDATNELGPVPDAVIGVIPSYYVMDLGASYKLKEWIKLEGGINNLTNSMYFTRRADGYPGPGIIPSDGRSFYLTLQFKLAASAFKKLPKK